MPRSAPNPTLGRRALRWLTAMAVAIAAIPAVLAATAAPAAAAGSVTLSKYAGLNAVGDTVTVYGSGYDTSSGVYVWFCQNTGSRPSGADCDGATQYWISDSPLAQMTPGALRWGPGGSFAVSLSVKAVFGSTDCTQVQCGVAVRNDHQSQGSENDSVTVVSFGEETQPTVTDPTTVPGSTSTTVPRPGEGEGPATDNDTRITLSKDTDLAGGETITVSGTGFEPEQGIYVRLCAAPEGRLGTEAGRATECYPEQDGTHTVWLTPVPSDGNWTTPLTVLDTFGDVDCREQSCGVFVRRDHSGGAADFSQDAFAPITFGDPSSTPTTAPVATGARLTVTPSSGIVSGATVTVEGAGFRAGHEIFVAVCDTAVANFAACDFENVGQVQVEHGRTDRAGGPGTFVTQLVARSKFGATDCGSASARCAVSTWAVSGNEPALEASAPIQFAGAGATPGAVGGHGAPGTATGGAPLARTGAQTTQLVLIGTLAMVAGAAFFAMGRRRTA